MYRISSKFNGFFPQRYRDCRGRKDQASEENRRRGRKLQPKDMELEQFYLISGQCIGITSLTSEHLVRRSGLIWGSVVGATLLRCACECGCDRVSRLSI